MPQTNVPSFAEMLEAAQHSAVHLEMRDAYGIESEDGTFRAWREGTWTVASDREARRAWFDLVRAAVSRGVVMRRARIVSEPATAYIRFEYEGTGLNVEAGEQVRWLPRRRASDLALPGNDFWLFDGTVVRFNHFTGDGGSAGPEVSDEPHVAKLCQDAFEAVWRRAVPHDEYTV
ncbi:hypothetical protein OEIGOIKO_03395 [Streptomyces chrestomyceticus JCM 4735]|uniref:DUF6879 domain-containing protein n=1 Tax=Streptomyces chrestomyceticus JCM 4735 TaxID=1306181 RepID=A0A7U9Q0U3_9ACTN|nr:DUF6879 family protein [Streptomyces chrestomyceticus]GCD35649.1 hypothetical protein OEIGOIKO_03395 [Streptomyces chrestomyceticus JCM 4735]